MNDSEMKHEGHHGMIKHGKHMHDSRAFWASWCSPVGLGIFALTGALALAIVLHTLAMLIGGAMMMHEGRDMRGEAHMDYPKDMPMMNAPAANAPGMMQATH